MVSLKRTGAPTHLRTDAQLEIVSGGGEGDHGLMRSGRGAETADRLDREAWGRGYKSAYAHHVNMPEEVAAGDYDTARQVLFRIQRMVEKGGWSGPEWGRLHQMEEAWGRRASGRDLQFNMRGWKKKHPGHNLSGFERVARDIQTAVDNSKGGRTTWGDRGKT